jgi:hypothetical protein
MKNLIRKVLKEETILPLYIRRRVSMEELDDLVLDVKDLIDSNYDKTDAIYDTVRQFVATKKEFKFNNETEQGYWDSYIEVEEPLVNYVKTNLHESKNINNTETFQYLIDMEMERMKEICFEQSADNMDDMVSFDVCDFLEYSKPEVEVTGIDNHNDKPVIIVKIKVSTSQLFKVYPGMDEESFVDELERRLIKWLGNNIIEVEDISFK